MSKDNKKNQENNKNKGEKNMDTAIVERYCTVEESIKQSCKEIKDYEQGKIKFKPLMESFAEWQQWAKEIEDGENKSK